MPKEEKGNDKEKKNTKDTCVRAQGDTKVARPCWAGGRLTPVRDG